MHTLLGGFFTYFSNFQVNFFWLSILFHRFILFYGRWLCYSIRFTERESCFSPAVIASLFHFSWFRLPIIPLKCTSWWVYLADVCGRGLTNYVNLMPDVCYLDQEAGLVLKCFHCVLLYFAIHFWLIILELFCFHFNDPYWCHIYSQTIKI